MSGHFLYAQNLIITMANWCYNEVRFSGDQAKVEAVHQMLREMEDRQTNSHEWHMPDFITVENSHFFDIGIADDVVSYRTRWVPNLLALVQIADHFDLGFNAKYEETAMLIYGEGQYDNGVAHDYRLTHEDLMQCTYDQESGLYDFNGQKFECQEEIFAPLLQAKIANNDCEVVLTQPILDELAIKRIIR
jgi:hypothetical protein